MESPTVGQTIANNNFSATYISVTEPSRDTDISTSVSLYTDMATQGNRLKAGGIILIQGNNVIRFDAFGHVDNSGIPEAGVEVLVNGASKSEQLIHAGTTHDDYGNGVGNSGDYANVVLSLKIRGNTITCSYSVIDSIYPSSGSCSPSPITVPLTTSGTIQIGLASMNDAGTSFSNAGFDYFSVNAPS